MKQNKQLTLDELIGVARNYTMSPEERREQMISFVYGNLAIENPHVTWDMVAELANDSDWLRQACEEIGENDNADAEANLPPDPRRGEH